RVEAIIGAMTKAERVEPDRIERSRAKRIAAGSGTARDEVSRLMKQFDGMSQMAKSMLGPDGTPREQPAIPGLPGVGKGNTQIKSRRAGAKKGKGKKRR
ncbi:MAG TPA: signal recognition particle protein, partial [Phycisphaerales bacterium]|nr:signal recognition particle protein [Phycisphaerales bacterium]